MWMVELWMIVSSIADVKHLTSRQEDQYVMIDKDTMADMNIPANDVPTKQAPASQPQASPTKRMIRYKPLRKCCQLDEQWFNLHKDILRDALQITPINDKNPFVAPPSIGSVIEYGQRLGIIPRKTAGHDRPRHPVLEIL
ncbi:hypothetical protein Tco_0719615 [Tanacetum coccineum]